MHINYALRLIQEATQSYIDNIDSLGEKDETKDVIQAINLISEQLGFEPPHGS